MSSQAQNPGQAAKTAPDCAERHEEEEKDAAVGNEGEEHCGDGEEMLAAAAGSSEGRDRVPSLQPPMSAFKVASISQEFMLRVECLFHI